MLPMWAEVRQTLDNSVGRRWAQRLAKSGQTNRAEASDLPGGMACMCQDVCHTPPCSGRRRHHKNVHTASSGATLNGRCGMTSPPLSARHRTPPPPPPGIAGCDPSAIEDERGARRQSWVCSASSATSASRWRAAVVPQWYGVPLTNLCCSRILQIFRRTR